MYYSIGGINAEDLSPYRHEASVGLRRLVVRRALAFAGKASEKISSDI